jgi:hypothetical protein
MAQTIKLRRSATADATPTTSQLALGELAINTNDGKLFIKKNEDILATLLVQGTTYTIKTVGNTNWTSIGAANSNIGTVFTKNSTTATGTGTATTESIVEINEVRPGAINLTVGAAPTNPEVGDMWKNSENLKTFVYYLNAPEPPLWVEI